MLSVNGSLRAIFFAYLWILIVSVEVVMMEVHFKLRCQTSFANIYLK
jgi:hypothetical protein